jgi:hypothetical protein
MIKLLDILKEINNPSPENLLGQELTDDEKGRYSAVYLYKPDPSKVIKVNKKGIDKKLNPQVIKDLKLMNQHPDIATKTFEITPYYAVIEKLNQQKTNVDMWEFREEIKKYRSISKVPYDFKKHYDSDYFVLEYIKLYLIKGQIDKMLIKINSPKLLSKIKKYILFIDKAIKAFGENVDIHAGNIGYDDKGNLKLLDI